MQSTLGAWRRVKGTGWTRGCAAAGSGCSRPPSPSSPSEGYGGFTIDGVATRAGVARSTIYRLGHDRLTLVAAAMETLNVQPTATPDDRPADPRDQVVVILTHLADAMRDSPMSDCLPALVDGAERDAGLRRLHHAYTTSRRATLVDAADTFAGHRRRPAGAGSGPRGRGARRGGLLPPVDDTHPARPEEVEPLVASVLGPATGSRSTPRPATRRAPP